ncbi:AmpG family muropeptide MFS transporter [Dissulfurimicrobium hydrothermale]|uniref:AmpG family muropeptide MFS transporter n=2 Tax=Deltaproteobacteria incertae sedis TaxID=45456 RepID=UPI001EDB65D6|nr:MFS transporter [Dissulfurimicrobium hydrothermale]UKL13725.1 MFS transporter [Dissulfurimicrobium hydrothermale]
MQPFNKRIAIMLPFGFSSGLPLALTGATLQAWLATSAVDIKTIGLFSLAGLPYAIKFLWSPIMDRFSIPWLGRRRGWIFLAQILLSIGLAFMATLSPAENQMVMGWTAFIIAFLSASQDIAIDAYRADVLRQEERGLGVAMTVTGYRIAMLVSGALALILSDRIGWMNTYRVMAAFMAVSIIITISSPKTDGETRPPRDINEAIAGPLKEFFSRRNALFFILFIILYKLPDAFASSLITAFLIKGPGFSPTEVGTVNKALGLASTMAGAFLGGWLMRRMGLFRSLLYFGVFQAISSLWFTALAIAGKSYPLLITSVTLENLSSGMGTAAFVSLMMALCNRNFTATQYALLSAVSATGRIFAGPPSGFLAGILSWPWFFIFSACVALPGLLLLLIMKKGILALERDTRL